MNKFLQAMNRINKKYRCVSEVLFGENEIEKIVSCDIPADLVSIVDLSKTDKKAIIFEKSDKGDFTHIDLDNISYRFTATSDDSSKKTCRIIFRVFEPMNLSKEEYIEVARAGFKGIIQKDFSGSNVNLKGIDIECSF